jgi:hypothetical protein
LVCKKISWEADENKLLTGSAESPFTSGVLICQKIWGGG